MEKVLKGEKEKEVKINSDEKINVEIGKEKRKEKK